MSYSTTNINNIKKLNLYLMVNHDNFIIKRDILIQVLIFINKFCYLLIYMKSNKTKSTSKKQQ